ncbi:hypothetical protein DYB28_001573 [Aphanomyces astaci]|uniref:Uncharacterized protein n=1 Tax=Aphanomyces astaci TaxID=112090 RepID=A0A9X8HA76_APHAT|nr:hypothetical protein DYB28_001573 [Aphanomyces astaci]
MGRPTIDEELEIVKSLKAKLTTIDNVVQDTRSGISTVYKWIKEEEEDLERHVHNGFENRVRVVSGLLNLDQVSEATVNASLELFVTEHKGIGLRALETIHPGQFMPDYVGEILGKHEFQARFICMSARENKTKVRYDAQIQIIDAWAVQAGRADAVVSNDAKSTLDMRKFGYDNFTSYSISSG